MLSNERSGFVFSDSGNIYWDTDKQEQVKQEEINEIEKVEYANNVIDKDVLEFENKNDKSYNKPLDDFSTLSDDERKIILCFRLLPYKAQEKIKDMVIERAKTEKRLANKFDFIS